MIVNILRVGYSEIRQGILMYEFGAMRVNGYGVDVYIGQSTV